MIGRNQAEYLDALSRMSNETDARVASLVRQLTERQSRWRPVQGGWSIDDVLEHLCIVHDSYEPKLLELLNSPGTPRAARDAEWSPTLVGGMMVKSFASDRKLPAPKIFRPAPTPRPNVLDEFLTRERALIAMLGRADDIDLRRVKLASPVSRVIRINLGDAFGILVQHARRHLMQMTRVRAMVGFPAS
jgi:hypothetical protein